MALAAALAERLFSSGNRVKVMKDEDGSLILKVMLVDDAGEAANLSGDVTNLENITITESALPDGAATEAKQDTGNAALAAIADAIGATDDTAWDGVDPDATVISLLKAIALNTAPA